MANPFPVVSKGTRRKIRWILISILSFAGEDFFGSPLYNNGLGTLKGELA